MTDAETWAREDAARGCDTSHSIAAALLEVLDAERAKVAPLTEELRSMIGQHCEEIEPGVYTTGCLRSNRDAMVALVDVGAMEPVGDPAEFIGRNYWARFKEGSNG